MRIHFSPLRGRDGRRRIIAAVFAGAVQVLLYFALVPVQSVGFVHPVQHGMRIMLLADVVFPPRIFEFSENGIHLKPELALKPVPIQAISRLIAEHRRADWGQNEPMWRAQLPKTRADWEKSLHAAARLTILRAQVVARDRLSFGFPNDSEFSPSKPTPRWDGWASGASRHFIQFSRGEFLMHFNGRYVHCVIGVGISPLAFGCGLGKFRAKGNLFKNMMKQLAKTNNRP